MTTDEPDQQLDPLSPADEARVRALLAGVRETEPMPADVAARLDDALGGLAAERAALEPVPADNVVPLTRTRRHRVVAVLGAAAAVAVLGLGIGTFFQQSGSDDMDDAGSADSALAERGGDDAHGEAPAETGLNDNEARGSEDGLETAKDFIVGDRAFVVRSRHLARDLARIQHTVLPEPDADYRRGLVHAPKGFACEIGRWGSGILVGVRYDGDPAYVAFSEPMGESQVVEVLQCRTGDLLRSTTLPTGG